jgi:3-oxoacyl-[acyl-carrier protein] reductase
MGLSQTMSVEWARYGIRVNVVAPGGVKSPRASRYRGSGRREGGLGNDGHRTVDPAEVAAGILFLASDLASGISGQVLTIDSGLSAKNYAGGLSQYSAIMESSAALMRGDD